MRNTVFFSLLLLLTGISQAMAADSLYLAIDLLESETGKDLNSQNYIIEVQGREVSYTYHYRGFPFPDNPDQAITRTLTGREFAEIISTIREDGLNQSITENRATAGNGPAQTVKLSVFIQLDGRITKSQISGTWRRFGRNDKENLIEHRAYVDAVRSLLQELKGLEGF